MCLKWFCVLGFWVWGEREEVGLIVFIWGFFEEVRGIGLVVVIGRYLVLGNRWVWVMIFLIFINERYFGVWRMMWGVVLGYRVLFWRWCCVGI